MPVQKEISLHRQREIAEVPANWFARIGFLGIPAAFKADSLNIKTPSPLLFRE